jgi:Xaa-Pro aminopeptidase
MYEYELEAEYVHEFMKNGARSCAYPSIVGGGKNACVLHYNENKDLLLDGDLVLVDAGCEYKGYASDITRTFPVSGKFSKPQEAIYEIVLEANRECIKTVIKDLTPFDTERKAVEIITQGLIDLNILNGEINELIETKAYQKFYMHKVGHWMGMDVHDVGSYGLNGDWRKYSPGMITTIEPGIYFKEGLKNVPKEFINIGIRIEDDVLVTEKNPEVLTSSVPKNIKDIEKIMES